MSARDWDVSGFDPEVRHIPPGVTQAILVTDPAYTSGGSIRYVSGGSLLLMRAPGVMNGQYGATWAGASLVALYNNLKYDMFGAAPINYNGAARYYLAAIGATATVQITRGLTPGYTD